MSDVHAAVDHIIDDLKDDTRALQSCRLVSADFQKQTRVERHLFRKIIFPRFHTIISLPIRQAVPHSKSVLLDLLAPYVRSLLVNPHAADHDSKFHVEDISRFEKLEMLGVTTVFWEAPRWPGTALSESLTTLEFIGDPFADDIPSARKLLQFIFAFPNLSSLGLQNVRLASPVGETVDDIRGLSGPTLRKLRLGFRIMGEVDQRATDTFVAVLRTVAIDPDVLEELYITGYKQGIELVKSCNALCVLTLILQDVDPDTIAPIPLRHIENVTIGFYMSDPFALDEDTLEWFKLSLLDITRPTQLKHFTIRCNGDGGRDTWGCEGELFRHLHPIDRILATLPLKTFTVTTSYEHFLDNPTCINRVAMIHGGIRVCFLLMKKKSVGWTLNEISALEPGWRIMPGFRILEGRTAMLKLSYHYLISDATRCFRRTLEILSEFCNASSIGSVE
ncbi:hypothetical protein BDZ89DRAFT_1067036 [Hymenopellis radicata]|nr:hypothetical protein BDZ89DRAFT_1067036 [Hymenopellis radicata]